MGSVEDLYDNLKSLIDGLLQYYNEVSDEDACYKAGAIDVLERLKYEYECRDEEFALDDEELERRYEEALLNPEEII